MQIHSGVICKSPAAALYGCRDLRTAVAESFAIDAASNARTCYYRSGYDFAVPLRHKWDFRNLTYVPPWEREYFLTVKVSHRHRNY